MAEVVRVPVEDVARAVDKLDGWYAGLDRSSSNPLPPKHEFALVMRAAEKWVDMVRELERGRT